MKPTYHPTDDILMNYAAATLGEGASLVIGTHLAMCEQCRAFVETCETVGGALLDDLEPTAMTPDAFAKVLRRIDATEGAVRTVRPSHAEIEPGLPMPEPLAGYAVEKWRFLAPGFSFARLSPAPQGKTKVFLLRAKPGAYLPEHGHGGDEFICVLKGSFSDSGGSYNPGDVAVANESVQHKPRVEPDGECICLVALEGSLKLRSLIGRMLQPVLGL